MGQVLGVTNRLDGGRGQLKAVGTDHHPPTSAPADQLLGPTHRQTTQSAPAPWPTSGAVPRPEPKPQGCRPLLRGLDFGGGGVHRPKTSTPLPCASMAAVPKLQAKQQFNANPVLRQARACARHTRDSKARYGTATLSIAMLVMAENHIKRNSMGLQCGVLAMNRMTITGMNEPPFPSTSASQTPNPAFRNTKKQRSQKILKTAVQRPLRACTRGGLGWLGWVKASPGRLATVRAAFPAGPDRAAVPGCPVTRPTGLLTARRPRGGARGREMPPCLCVCALVCLWRGGGGCGTPACSIVVRRWRTWCGEVCAWCSRPRQGGWRA